MSEPAKSAVAAATKKYGVLGAIFYSRVAMLIAPALIRGGVSPNGVTIIGFVLFVLGCFGLTSPNMFVALAGFIVLHAGVVFDYADGIVARATNRTSFFGSWLDNCSDRAADFLVTLLAAIAVIKTATIDGVVGMTLIGSSVFLMGYMHYMHDIGYFYRSSMAKSDVPPQPSAGVVQYAARAGAMWLMLFNRDTLVLLLSLSLLLKGSPAIFAAVLLVLVANIALLSVREYHQGQRPKP